MGKKKDPSRTKERQLDAFEVAVVPSWPPPERNPFNYWPHKVEDVLHADLLASGSVLLITGYTSLPRIIRYLAACHSRLSAAPNTPSRTQILIGHDPIFQRRRSFPLGGSLDQDITDFWLTEGFSILLSGQVVRAIEFLNQSFVEIRASGKTVVHAKIYVSDLAVTGGSSNYSDAGLTWQIEANWRFEAADHQRYADSKQLAEAIWSLGVDYKEGLLGLLKRMLYEATWQEALARSCAELLEGEWARRYLQTMTYGGAPRLWPSQDLGLAQAMWVVANYGSVLVADATGSGKTKLGAHLIRAVQLRNWRTGTVREDMPVIVCPPAVKEAWLSECTTIGFLPDLQSHGVLSNVSANLRGHTLAAIKRAQTLAVDEAHNFINRTSLRTRALHANSTDHVVLFTATPISRGPQDLLSIIDLLGGDNFDDHLLTVVTGAWKRRRRNSREQLTAEEKQRITDAIRQFTVRRTKADLNRLVDRDPDQYLDAKGNRCRYPRHVAHFYPGGETEQDRRIAKQIRRIAADVKGVAFFNEVLKLSEYLKHDGWDDERYLRQRLASAKALAAHHISSKLRSSKAALIEHLEGTQTALAVAGLASTVRKKPAGDLIGKLRAGAGTPPGSELDIDVPAWFIDADAHVEASRKDESLYEQIKTLVGDLSEAREDAKVMQLVKLLATHEKILAFDSRPITLFVLEARLQRAGVDQVIVGTGADSKSRKDILKTFRNPDTSGARVALCSDVLAEGINLQGASAVVLLDMPSVIRVAEQRIGRIDRMDAPHDHIDVYWPDDSAEFALHSDELFLIRHKDVSDLLGSNVPLPSPVASAFDKADHLVRPSAYAESIERLAAEGGIDNLGDAFSSVRNLVEGDSALVDEALYRQIKRSKAQVRTCVTVLRSDEEWSFYAIQATERGAPRWVFLNPAPATPIVDLDTIAIELRQRLVRDPQSLRLTDEYDQRLLLDQERLRAFERHLLPRKKLRALEEMGLVLARYAKDAADTGDTERLREVDSILTLLDPESEVGWIDYQALSDWWLDLIRPTWYEHISNRRRLDPALLREIRRPLHDRPIPTDHLRTIRDVQLAGSPLDQRVIAAIIGVALSGAQEATT